MSHVPDIVAAEIEKLRAAGIEPTLEELAQLLYWGRRVENPAGEVSPLIEDAGIVVGRHVLRPLSVQAEHWMSAVQQWMGNRLLPYAYAFAAEAGREVGAFDGLYNRRAAVDVVDAWRRRCAEPIEFIRNAVDRLIGEPLPSDSVTVTETGDFSNAIADPDDAGAIPVTKSGRCPIVTAGAETRTLAIPNHAGQILVLELKTDGGDCVVTVASAINTTGNNTITFDDAGDFISLQAVDVNGTLAWRVLASSGVALSTV